ncbi:MAG: hemolysin III family protein [Clostridia bacterium]
MQYTKGEEIANSITHGIGALFAIAGLIIMIIFSAFTGDVWKIVSVTIYGVTLVILYTFSTLYHAITNKKAKKFLQIFDHSSVYLLIAGTYTPFSLVTLRNCSYKGWLIFGIVWAVALFGIFMQTVFPRRFKFLNVSSYVLVGWIIIFVMKDLIQMLSLSNSVNALWLLLAGGIAYTIGVIFYSLKKMKYFHFIWHLFVLIGSILHFIAIMFYII